MDIGLLELVYESVDEVFGKMFFTFLKLPEDASILPADAEPIFVEAAIGLTAGEESGRVVLYFPEALARHITLNFLGVGEDGLDEKKIYDTLGEAANMTVGNLLGRLDPQEICGNLGIPEVRGLAGMTVGDLSGKSDLVAFESDFGCLLLEVSLLKACFVRSKESG